MKPARTKKLIRNSGTALWATLFFTFCLGCSSNSEEHKADVLGNDEMTAADTVLPAEVLDSTAGQDLVQPVLFPDAVATHLKRAMAEYLAFSGDPGVSVALRLATGAMFVEAAGITDVVVGTPMSTTTSFRVGSNTKPYFSALIMILVDEGLVQLDDPLSMYVTDYPLWQDITIRMLLGMQSGIPDYLLSEAFMITAVFNPDTLTTPDILLGFVKDQPLLFQPGTDCVYTNTNYILIGLVIEQVTGQVAEDALQTRLLEPLGLDNTYLDVVDEEKPDLSHGYMDLAIVGFLFGLTADAVALIPEDWFMKDYVVDATYLFPPMFAWTDGGVVTTPEDAMTFMRALLTGKIVTPESLAEMQKTSVCPIMGMPVDYGMGLSTATGGFGTRWGHGGLNFGYEANTIYFPDRDVTLSHMHNYLPEQSYRLEDEILAILDQESPEPAGPACAVPQQLYSDEADEVVQFRFKGPIQAEDTEFPAPGTTLIKARLGGETIALYGFGTYAAEQSDTGMRRVDVISVAPSLTAGVDQRTAVVSIEGAVLEGADGEVLLEEPDDLVVLILETVLDPDTKGVQKTCVVAVPDATRPAALHLCGGSPFQAGPGDILRVFGVAPVDRDPAVVESFLNLISLPRCSCADGQGGFAQCP